MGRYHQFESSSGLGRFRAEGHETPLETTRHGPMVSTYMYASRGLGQLNQPHNRNGIHGADEADGSSIYSRTTGGHRIGEPWVRRPEGVSSRGWL